MFNFNNKKKEEITIKKEPKLKPLFKIGDIVEHKISGKKIMIVSYLKEDGWARYGYSDDVGHYFYIDDETAHLTLKK